MSVLAPRVEWLVQVRRGVQKAHAFVHGASLSACTRVRDTCMGAAQSFDGRCTHCERALQELQEQSMAKTKQTRSTYDVAAASVGERAVYDAVLKAMRKRQRERRRTALKHHTHAETLTDDPTRCIEGYARSQHVRIAQAKDDEADGMAELILMVKNMRDHGADAS